MACNASNEPNGRSPGASNWIVCPVIGVTAALASDGWLAWLPLLAITWNCTGMPLARPVTVIGDCVPSAHSPVDAITAYWTMGAPPVCAGAVKLTTAWPSPAAATTWPGASGATAAMLTVSGWCALAAAASVTSTLTLNVPATCGVPCRRPEVSSTNPAGKVPLLMPKL